MLAINMFYMVSIFLPIISIISLIFSIKNKDITVYKNIRIISIVYIIYMFMNFCILPSLLYLEVGLEIIILLPIQIIALIIYIISISICSRKIKKINGNNIKNSKIYSVSIALILLPILILIIIILKEITLLNTSDLVLVYDNSGNGGFGDGKTLVYTIKQNYCKKVSIGSDFGAYKIENFFIKPSKKSKIYEYNIEYNSNNGYIIKNLNYFSEKDTNFNEINKTELEYIILDIKKNYNNLNQIYISYLKESNYYVIEIRELDSVFIYEGQKCIHKINLSGNIEIEEAFIFQ